MRKQLTEQQEAELRKWAAAATGDPLMPAWVSACELVAELESEATRTHLYHRMAPYAGQKMQRVKSAAKEARAVLGVAILNACAMPPSGSSGLSDHRLTEDISRTISHNDHSRLKSPKYSVACMEWVLFMREKNEKFSTIAHRLSVSPSRAQQVATKAKYAHERRMRAEMFLLPTLRMMFQT